MSKVGLRIARLFGGRLPTFPSQADAERALFEMRDSALAGLTRAASHAPDQFVPDLTPESLKALEAWYFAVLDRGQFPSVGTSREGLEEMLTMAFADHYTARNNKRRQSIYRRYRHHYG